MIAMQVFVFAIMGSFITGFGGGVGAGAGVSVLVAIVVAMGVSMAGLIVIVVVVATVMYMSHMHITWVMINMVPMAGSVRMCTASHLHKDSRSLSLYNLCAYLT